MHIFHVTSPCISKLNFFDTIPQIAGVNEDIPPAAERDVPPATGARQAAGHVRGQVAPVLRRRERGLRRPC